jgi:lipid-A-disaccharide synthase
MTSLLIVAGETSGDQLGAALVQALMAQVASVRIYGVGGDQMRRAGVETLFDIERLNAVGIAEICTKIPYGLYMARRLLQAARERGTRLVVLVDAPGFNLPFAYLAKRMGLRVVYYVSPQIWAWRQGRVKKVARRVDAMLTLFPFEVPFYTSAGVQAAYVGHPIVDRLETLPSVVQSIHSLGLDPDRQTVAVLPGSRGQEIRQLLLPMLAAVALMRQQHPTLQAVLPLAPAVNRHLVTSLLEQAAVPVTLVQGQSLEALQASQVALVASGTATLEAGLIGTPMVVLYKVHPVTELLARWLIRVPHIGLVNIVAGKQIVPELLQRQVQPHTIATHALRYLNDIEATAQTQREFARLRGILGLGGSAERAAAQVAQCLAEAAADAAPSTATGV